MTGDLTFELYDVFGKRVNSLYGLRAGYNGFIRFAIDRSNLNAGVYLFQATNDSGEKVSGRLVVE